MLLHTSWMLIQYARRLKRRKGNLPLKDKDITEEVRKLLEINLIQEV